MNSPAFRATPFGKGGLRGTLAALTLAMACLSTPAVGASSETELKVKAAFLFNFAKFANWPEKKFAASGSPMVLCILEDDPIGPVLENTVSGKLIESRTLLVRRSKTPANWNSCHIAFINTADSQEVDEAFGGLSGSSVLTVHESSRSRHDGVIRLFVEDRRMRFEINRAASEREALQLSAKLMSAAVVVRE